MNKNVKKLLGKRFISVILVVGIGGTYLKLGNFQLTSIALSTIFGIVLNLILPKKAASEAEHEKKIRMDI